MSNEVLEQQAGQTVAAPEVTCVKCNSTTPWGSSSWCPDCGYYPGVTDVLPQTEVLPEQEEEETAIVAEKTPLLPQWVILAIAIPTTIILLSLGARYYFTFYGGDRSLFSFIMFLAGIAALLGAHLLTSFKSMQNDSNCSPFDLIGHPIEMWRPTIRELPKTGNRIVVAVSGFTAFLSALVITGGIDFASIFADPWVQPEGKKDKGGIIGRMMQNAPEKEADPDQTMEEAFEELSAVPEELDESMQALLPSPDDPLTCVVYGYMKDGEDDFGRLLLAATVGGQRVHVGTLDASELPKHVRENLAARLRKLEREKSSVETRYMGGTFVRPSIGLNIEFDSWTGLGELSNPRLSLGKKSDEDASSDADN